jgi:hypothetical protein
MAEPPGMDALIDAYLKVRAKRDEVVERAKELSRRMSVLEGAMLAQMQKLGTDQFRSATCGGTAYQRERTTFVVEDAEVFREFCGANGMLEMMKAAVTEEEARGYLERTGQPPPGVRVNRVLKVGVRKGAAS